MEAGAWLAIDDGWRVLVTGDAAERPLVEAVAAGIPGAVPLAGALDLDGLAALLAAVPVLVANNTGPAHLAAAVGTPVVSLYAQTNRQHTPWGVPSRVLTRDVPCRDCLRSVCPLGHHACLAPVRPDEIVEAVRAIALAPGHAPARRPAGPVSPACKARGRGRRRERIAPGSTLAG